MKLVLRNTSGQTVSLFIEPDETFEDLKKRVQAEVGIALDLQDLTIKGKNITDNQRVIDYFTCPESRKIEDISELQQDVKCSVPTCENTKLLYPEKAFFMFPLEEMRCHQWALYCHRLSDVSGKHRPTLTAQSVICADHFRKDQFVKNTTTLLKRTAVPCVNPDVSLNTSDSATTKRKSVLRPALYPAKSEITVPLSISTLESTLALLHQPNIDEKNLVFCRICATLCSNFIFIFDDVGVKLKIADKINSCLPIIIRDSDPLPKQICRPCFDKLSHCHEICELSLNAETKLRNMISDNLFSSVPVGENEMCDETDQKSVMNCDGISNLNQMPTTSNTNKSKPLFCCPLCTHGKMVTKSGIYKANHILPTEVYTICRSDDGKHNGVLQTSDKLCDTDKYIHVTNQCATTTEGKFKDFVEQESWSAKENTLKIQDLDIDTLYNDTESIVGMEIDSIPENEDWNEIEEKIDSKITVKGEIESLVCRICGIEFSESSALLDHSEDHSDIDCCPCTVCDQWFTSKSALSNHFIEHHLGNNFIDFLHKCEFCGTTFKSITRLESHVCGSNSGTNKCSHCDKSFRSMARLQFHQRFHNGAKPGYCELCQKTFPDELKLYKHTMYLHSQNKGHCCEECGKIFRSNSSLRYHQRSHQGEHVMKPYSCEYCGKCFIRKSMLRSHFINTHKNKSREGTCFTCKLCYEAFPSTDHAVNHMDITHIPECSGESTYSFEMHTVKRLYLCEYCEKCFTDPINLNTHREQHPPEFPYQCKICPESFSSSSLLGMHKKSHPTAEIQDYINEFTVPMWYMCEFCERCFLSNVKLSEHLTVHFGEEPYHCRFCDVKYKTNAEVQEHRLTHDQILSPVDDSYRPYECHYCPKSFSIEDALVKHIRMHTGEKPFICDQCGKGFSQSSGLYTHQKVHSDERPYNCPVCPRKFKIKGDRDVHVRKHSGDRPYKCDFCGKAFMTQHVYSQHRKIHTGERPYKCDVCGIAFRRSHVLTVHKRIHTGEKPNICDICGKRYRQKGDMLKHRRLQHGIVKVRIQKIEF